MRNVVCVVTGTRAEYGLLRPLLGRLAGDQEIELRIVATGAHLSPEFGLTYRQIESDGYAIHRRLEILLSSDSRCGVNKAIGLGFIAFGDYFEAFRPDILVLLGDRYEAFAAGAAAAIAGIPVAHIHGGEVTEGSTDDFMRHSITKMSRLHFPCAAEYARRIERLGEDPSTVHDVGALGLENIRGMELLDRMEVERRIGCAEGQRYALVTFHPATQDEEPAPAQVHELLAAVDAIPELWLAFTKANADAGGREINMIIEGYVAGHRHRSSCFDNMGQLLYLSSMRHSALVLGNSSSGIIEAPGFPVPTVNIGDRQRGRARCASIIDCRPRREEIVTSIRRALSPEFLRGLEGMRSPYGDGDASRRIHQILKEAMRRGGLTGAKPFHDADTTRPDNPGK